MRVSVSQWFSSRPRVIVRDAAGNPLAGRYCSIRDLSDNGINVEALRISYKCGPSVTSSARCTSPTSPSTVAHRGSCACKSRLRASRHGSTPAERTGR
eukprot:4094096-Prymnesium_polylepis.1